MPHFTLFMKTGNPDRLTVLTQTLRLTPNKITLFSVHKISVLMHNVKLVFIKTSECLIIQLFISELM